MTVALVLPPLSQLNTPYPSISYLGRALRDAGESVTQRDLGIELVGRLLSREGLSEVFERVDEADALPEPAWRALALRQQHLDAVEPVVAFLRGQDRAVARRIVSTPMLPLGPRLERAEIESFGPLSVDDAARYLATLYVEDLLDLVRSCVDPFLEISRYAHHLAVGPVQYDPIAERLASSGMVDAWLDALTDTLLAGEPEAVGISVPFPGTLYGAVRIGQRVRAAGVPVIMGGGYVSTELREVDEPRLWACTDALVYDDGVTPLLAWLEHLRGARDDRHRTRTAEGLHDGERRARGFVPAAWTGDLDLRPYLQVADSLNPTHRLWSELRWNKATLAHGCYWHRCAFCDVGLDYVARFERAGTQVLVDAMEEQVALSEVRGFHFVDEAAPPRALRDLALELLRRGHAWTWWGNIRFESSFTPDLARLLAAAGMVAVTGGLEAASDAVLQRMDKGVTVEQAARAAQAFTDAGILVHAYLMYGFPGETAQETIDAMELVRQLFAEGVVDSAFWHRFVLTRHSRVFREPQRYGVQPVLPEGPVFATNDIPHLDTLGVDPEPYDAGLVAALEAWMLGEGLDRPLGEWFDLRVPRPSEPRSRVRRALRRRPPTLPDGARLVWLGGEPLDDGEGALLLHHPGGTERIAGTEALLDWVSQVIEGAAVDGPGLRVAEAREACPEPWKSMGRRWRALRRAGLVGV